MKFIAALIGSAAAYTVHQDVTVQGPEKYAEEKYKFTAAHQSYDGYSHPASYERVPHEFEREADEDRVRVHYIDMLEHD
jgi:hypothetical protein